MATPPGSKAVGTQTSAALTPEPKTFQVPCGFLRSGGWRACFKYTCPLRTQAWVGFDGSTSGKRADPAAWVSDSPGDTESQLRRAVAQGAQYLLESCAPYPASHTPAAPLGGTGAVCCSGRAAAANTSPPPAPCKGPSTGEEGLILT